MRSPPTPRLPTGPRRAANSRATLDACKSPDGSPATNRMSRTRNRRQRRRLSPLQRGHRLLDLPDDSEGDLQCIAAVLPGHDDRRVTPDCREETLVLQTQRFALRRLQLDVLDE